MEGALETRKALNKLAPDLYREMNKEIRVILKEIQTDARGHVLSPYPSYLYNWADKGKTREQPQFNVAGRVRKFPLYNPAEIKRGLQYRIGATKRNRAGFSMLYYMVNKSAAGSIFETAGRHGYKGQKHIGKGFTRGASKKGYSSSNNPDAGAIFINAFGPLYGKSASFMGDQRGRLAYRAVYENQGRAIKGIEAATQSAISKYYARKGTEAGTRTSFGKYYMGEGLAA